VYKVQDEDARPKGKPLVGSYRLRER
jgi:hypothetical protein